jgi:hypothetical protein
MYLMLERAIGCCFGSILGLKCRPSALSGLPEGQMG